MGVRSGGRGMRLVVVVVWGRGGVDGRAGGEMMAVMRCSIPISSGSI